MGILDMFRKKKDDFGDPYQGHPDDQFMQSPEIGQPMGVPGMQDPMGMPGSMPQQPFPGEQPQAGQPFSPEQFGYERITPQNAQFYKTTQQQPQELSNINMGKDLELISAKLDAIKAELDSVNQRLKRIERLAEDPAGAPRRDNWQY